MQQLPLLKDPDRAQTIWKSILDPLLAKPLSSSNFLQDLKITTGVNVINHKLGRQMQGWVLTDINQSITVYRSGAFNALTLSLTSSGDATISLIVF